MITCHSIDAARHRAQRDATRDGKPSYVLHRPDTAPLGHEQPEYAVTHDLQRWGNVGGWVHVETFGPEWKQVPFGSLPLVHAQQFAGRDARDECANRYNVRGTGNVVRRFERGVRAGGASLTAYVVVVRRRPQ